MASRVPQWQDFDLQTLQRGDLDAVVDDIFTHYPIRDVKNLQIRAVADADAKREDLRLMVGERYRDLLAAADSIVRMRSSTQQMSKNLEIAKSKCSRHVVSSPNQKLSITTNESAQSQYGIATLIKLLLDCPEHIWRAIDRADFLSAARLEGVARTVYRELMQNTKHNIPTAFPIVGQQWSTLEQIGPAIIRAAQSTLQDWNTPAYNLASTIASILLIENMSVLEALSQLLQYRREALKQLLQTHPSAMQKSISTESITPSHAVDSVTVKLERAFGLLVSTADQASTLFAPRNSLLLEMLQSLQDSGSSPLTGFKSPLSKSDVEHTFHKPVVEAGMASILMSLPNAYLLLRYVPPSILNFTHFIDMNSARTSLSSNKAAQIISDWFEASVHLVNQATKQLLDTCSSAKQLTKIYETLKFFLSHDHTQQEKRHLLLASLEQTIEARLDVIYREQLGGLTAYARTALEDSLEAPQDFATPASFIMSSASLPWPPTYSVSRTSSAADPFVGFRKGVKSRLTARSPATDNYLSGLEHKAQNITDDVKIWFESVQEKATRLKHKYCDVANDTLKHVVAIVDERMMITDDIKGQLLIGDIALQLAQNSPFASMVSFSQQYPAFSTSLTAIFERSTASWQSSSSTKALDLLSSTLFSVTSSPETIESASYALLHSLQYLVDSLAQIGPHRLAAKRSISTELFEGYLKLVPEIYLEWHKPKVGDRPQDSNMADKDSVNGENGVEVDEVSNPQSQDPPQEDQQKRMQIVISPELNEEAESLPIAKAPIICWDLELLLQLSELACVSTNVDRLQSLQAEVLEEASLTHEEVTKATKATICRMQTQYGALITKPMSLGEKPTSLMPCGTANVERSVIVK